MTNVNRTVKILRKIGVLLVGVPILIVGILLIPLPGPGILISMLGLFIISLEFDIAQPYLQKAKERLMPLWRKFKDEYQKLKE